jgi:acyl transferase domain-containing protein
LAIIGIGCLFPKAAGPGFYWANIKHGVDSITDVPPTHWNPDDYFDPDPKKPDMTYARRGGFLSAVEFNPMEFGIAPRDIEATDTTQLLGLVAAKQALLDAGITFRDAHENSAATAGPASIVDRDRVSVILGVTGTLELVIPLGARLGHPKWKQAMRDAGIPAELIDDAAARIAESYVPWQENSFPGLLGNVVAGRIANKLDLGGTNCVVDAACASSLSAVHLAALELQAGRCDVAVTGGCDTFNDIFMYMCFSKTPALSPTGDAKPFDEGGDGTILGEGLGIVVLKRLPDAQRDGDTIYAVLKAVGSSSDGKGKAIYEPSAAGQKKALLAAYELAGVSPRTIELVEAHGTGTKVGDTVEITALTEVYTAAPPTGEQPAANAPWCAIGSVKSQIGHTKAAAGAASLIKATLALYNKVLPPTIKVKQPIEPLRAAHSPFYVNTVMRPWLPRRDHPRRAALSAFGFGGSNFHAVLEEHSPHKQQPDWDGFVEIVALSADSPQALRAELAKLPTEWDAFAQAAEESRATFRPTAECRLCFAVHRTHSDLAKQLAAAEAQLAAQPHTAWHRPEGLHYGRGHPPGRLAVLFPGQGSQYVGMLREAACLFPEMLDTLAAANDAVAGISRDSSEPQRLSDFIYPPPAFDPHQPPAQEAVLRDTRRAQPALGAVSLGAWRVLHERFGLTADAFAGHSYGELVALAAAGWLSETDLFALSRLRGELMAAQRPGDPGAMLAVFASPAEIDAVLAREGLNVVVANRNAPQQTVLAGSTDAIDQAAARLAQARLKATKLPVAAAFHSPLVADAAAPFRAALDRVAFRCLPAPPVYANTTAAPYPADESTAKDQLARQLAQPVAFVEQIRAMAEAGIRTFVEVGPGSVLTRLVEAILAEMPTIAHAECIALDASHGQRPGLWDWANSLARLAAAGYALRLSEWEKGSRCRPPRPARTKPGLTVSICGANWVSPRAKRPPRPPVPMPSNNGKPHSPTPAFTASTPATGSTMSAPERERSATDPHAVAQALAIAQQSLAAIQRMQEQTAALHKQFLDHQDTAQRTFHTLLEQQQALVLATLGTSVAIPPLLPPAPLPAPGTVAPSPAAAPGAAPPLASPVGAVSPVTPPAAPPAATLPGVPSASVAVSSPTAGPQPTPRAASPGATVPPPGPAAPTPATTGPTAGNDAIAATLLAVVSEKTGYPVDSLDLSLSLDADLGVDSIKRVEILSALQEKLPNAPVVKPEHLGTLHTLQDVAQFLAGASIPSSATTANAVSSPASVPSVNGHEPKPAAVAAPEQAETLRVPVTPYGTERVERSTVQVADLDANSPRPRLTLPAGSEFWIVASADPLSEAIAQRLRTHGVHPRRFDWNEATRTAPPTGPLAGLLLLAPAAPEERLNHRAFDWLKLAAGKLRQTGRSAAAVFVTVARLDGAFGFADLAPMADPTAGGLAGLVKTARHEWPEVHCKAIDLAPAFHDPAAAASALVEELLTQGPVEVGIAPTHRCTLALARPVRQTNPQLLALGSRDVILITGGGRGVTAEAAVALAETYTPTLILTGRTPAPAAEPDYLTGLTDEAEMKKAIAEALGSAGTPRRVGEVYQNVLAQREIRHTLERIQKTGARVAYIPADVAQPAAVAALVEQVRAQYGPITAVIHGAGVLADKRIEDLTGEQFDRVYATKVDGLRALLKQLPPEELKALVLFSSTTARLGRTGQLAYACANEVLNKIAQVEARRRPHCRVVAINWGPWDGGMVTPALQKLFASEGVGVIPRPEGALFLVQELNAAGRAVEVVALASPLNPTPASAASAPSPSPTTTPTGSPATTPASPEAPVMTPPHPLPSTDLALAFERLVDVETHPVLRSHVLNGIAVVPVAIHLEWLAHAALHGHPGFQFHGFNDLRVTSGIKVEAGVPVSLRALAGKAVKHDKVFVVPVELRGRRKDGREVLHSRAEIVLAPTLPKPPMADPAPPVVRAAYDVRRAYSEFLFHGIDLQGIADIVGRADRAFVGRAYPAPPPADWFEFPLRSGWLADPLVLDSAFQMMILWTQGTHATGSLPSYIGRYRQFRKNFPADPTTIIIRVTRDDSRLARADIDFLAPDGSVIAQMQDYECVMEAELNAAFRKNQLLRSH